MKKKKQNTTKGTIGIDVKQPHQLGLGKPIQKKAKNNLHLLTWNKKNVYVQPRLKKTQMESSKGIQC